MGLRRAAQSLSTARFNPSFADGTRFDTALVGGKRRQVLQGFGYPESLGPVRFFELADSGSGYSRFQWHDLGYLQYRQRATIRVPKSNSGALKIWERGCGEAQPQQVGSFERKNVSEELRLSFATSALRYCNFAVV